MQVSKLVVSKKKCSSAAKAQTRERNRQIKEEKRDRRFPLPQDVTDDCRVHRLVVAPVHNVLHGDQAGSVL